ncbi:hypothetical protein GCK32_018291, partial [Trichostrongylus colubriformis]
MYLEQSMIGKDIPNHGSLRLACCIVLHLLFLVLLSGTGPEIWTSVEDVKMFSIKKKENSRKRRESNDSSDALLAEIDNEEPIKLRMRNSVHGEYVKGDLIYGDPEERLPYLCSRKAMYSTRGMENLVSEAQNLGFTLTVAKDRNGNNRPFVVLNNVFAVEALSKFDASYKDFKHACD